MKEKLESIVNSTTSRYLPGLFPDYNNLFSWEELDRLINLPPFSTSNRVKVPNMEEAQWGQYAWSKDINSWPTEILKEQLSTGVLIVEEASRANKQVNALAKGIEEAAIKNRPVDLHVFADFKPSNDHPFSVHWDLNANLIVQIEGSTRWRVWDTKGTQEVNNLPIERAVKMLGEPDIDTILTPGDALFIPENYWHLAASEEKRLSLSFCIAPLYREHPKQKRIRDWVSTKTLGEPMKPNIKHIQNLHLFPTVMYEFEIPETLVDSITKSIEENKMMNTETEGGFYSQNQDSSIYYTDFESPNNISEVEEVLENIQKYFSSIGLTFEVLKYWSAAYRDSAVHTMHTHRGDITGHCNYSGVIHLSNIGSTTFFSTSPTSAYDSADIPSTKGRVVMFPSAIPHAVQRHQQDEWRYVVPFNAKLYHNKS